MMAESKDDIPTFESGKVTQLTNVINGKPIAPKGGSYMDVFAPHNGEKIATVPLSEPEDVELAVRAAKQAFPAWSALTVRARAQYMYKFRELVHRDMDKLVEICTLENGKNRKESRAEIAKGLETAEWAASLPALIKGSILQVSRGVTCQDKKEPIGVVSCIAPFNFPFMVPMWTVPIALVTGNCVILKPSEKVPYTAMYTAALMKEAGIPPGVFQLVHGATAAVTALCDHPEIEALSFVGSSRVAEIVSQRCRALNKRVMAMGGAKNHLVALEDCDTGSAARDIVASFCGCAGQRCMAASVLLLVGDSDSPCKELLEQVVAKAAAIALGQQPGEMGPVIDAQSQARIVGHIDAAVERGAKILLDGRKQAAEAEAGHWVGPTILMFSNADDPCVKTEIFGPVLSVVPVKTWEEALAIENGDPHGNAASIYTSIGAHAEWFCPRFRAGMIGVNIGVPVPREPFSFGGMYGTLSKFGDFDVTGEGAMNFFTRTRKITSKWTKFLPRAQNQARKAGEAGDAAADVASFAGQM